LTCIAGLIDNGTIYMGADSASVAGYEIQRRADSKVFINGDFIIGFTSSFRMGQLLRYSFAPPAIKEKQDVFAYMVTDFVDAVRTCLKQGGYAKVENGEDTGGTFLVGYKGRLFCIESDFQVAEARAPYNACGCGQGYALGSLYSTQGKSPTDRITQALQAAEEFSAGVRSPFNIVQLNSEVIT